MSTLFTDLSYINPSFLCIGVKLQFKSYKGHQHYKENIMLNLHAKFSFKFSFLLIAQFKTKVAPWRIAQLTASTFHNHFEASISSVRQHTCIAFLLHVTLSQSAHSNHSQIYFSRLTKLFPILVNIQIKWPFNKRSQFTCAM